VRRCVLHVFAGYDPNWFYTFMGAMLLLALLVNLYVKNYAPPGSNGRQ
jgi:hypothetical protein